MLHKNLNNIMELDRKAFVYGNIKPDMTCRLLNKPHTLENYFLTICNDAEKLMNNKSSIPEFSLKLGEICHYVCDFFCQYHVDDELFHRLKEHFIYELRLHFELHKNSSKINIRPKSITAKKNISSIIVELRKEYSDQPIAMRKDLEYAFKATMWISESIAYFSYISLKQPENKEVDASYLTLPVAGGQ